MGLPFRPQMGMLFVSSPEPASLPFPRFLRKALREGRSRVFPGKLPELPEGIELMADFRRIFFPKASRASRTLQINHCK